MERFELNLACYGYESEELFFGVAEDFYGNAEIIPGPEYQEYECLYEYRVAVVPTVPGQAERDRLRNVRDQIVLDLIRRGLAHWVASDEPGCSPDLSLAP